MEITRARKKEALSRGVLACVGEIKTLNVTRGCGGQCLFCYARCYSGAPEPGRLMLYDELAEQLRGELKSPRRQASLPRWVLLNSASDGFLGGPEVQAVAGQCVEALVEHQIGVSISTRGLMPREVIALLGRHARHTRVFVPLVSMDPEYTSTWEPGTAPPHKRLLGVRRMMEAGLRPRLRLEPIIPFINDTTASLRATLSAVAGIGLSSVIVSFMHLRPGVAEQVEREASDEHTRLVLGSFPQRDQTTGVYQRMSLTHIRASFERIRTIADGYGVKVVACHCQNPGLPTTRCPLPPQELPTPVGQQRRLAFGAPEADGEPGGQE